jgi:hypothetical protein
VYSRRVRHYAHSASLTAAASQPRTSILDRVIGLVASRSFAPYTALVGLYVIFRAGSFTNMPDRLTDTSSYERVAHLALWNWRFYAGERGFTVPLFYKAFTSSESRIVAQLVLSTLAWLVLAAVVARCVRNPWLRGVVFAVVLAFSLTTEVILWDTLLLSESVALSLTALLCAAALVLAARPGPGRCGVFLALLLLWTFARDSNAYEALFLAPVAALTMLSPAHRRIKLVVAVSCLAVFGLGLASADAGRRWLQPLQAIVSYRVLPSRTLSAYFEHRGLQPASNWPASSATAARMRTTYVDYLVSHPGYLLAAPFHDRQQTPTSTPRNVESVLDPNLRPYNDNASHRFLTLPKAAQHVLFPRGPIVVLILLALSAVAVGWTARGRSPPATWIVPLALLATTYPHLLTTWHLSGMEVDRHALEPALLLRLAILLQLAFAVDWALQRRRELEHRTA